MKNRMCAGIEVSFIQLNTKGYKDKREQKKKQNKTEIVIMNSIFVVVNE